MTTEVQITAESSGSQTPPATPAASIEPVLHKTVAPHHPWRAPDDDAVPISPTAAGHAKPFTTISSISSARARETKTRGNAFARVWGRFTYKLQHLDPVKLAYLRTSFVFAISILVTWTPSSINRVYSLVYPHRTSYALNLAGAVVLPLQGVWNAIIFTATSWSALKLEFQELARRGRGRRWVGLGSRRLSDGRGGQAVVAGFRDGGAGAADDCELATSPRMANVRVIRGGSL